MELLCLAPQNPIEFWAVATRSRNENGLGMTHAIAAGEIEKPRRLFRLLPSNPNVLDAWQRIVLNLAAAMEVYSVSSILTFNSTHFGRFSGIAVIDPAKAV